MYRNVDFMSVTVAGFDSYTHWSDRNRVRVQANANGSVKAVGRLSGKQNAKAGRGVSGPALCAFEGRD